MSAQVQKEGGVVEFVKLKDLCEFEKGSTGWPRQNLAITH